VVCNEKSNFFEPKDALCSSFRDIEQALRYSNRLTPDCLAVSMKINNLENLPVLFSVLKK